MTDSTFVLPTDKYLAVKAVMMPRDTNPYGTIFGGVLLSYIDQAGVVGAQEEFRRQGLPGHPLVTVAMDKVEFLEPVFVGDTVSFWTRVQRIGRTSVTIQVTVTATRHDADLKLTEALVTYVAVSSTDDGRCPIPIRPEGDGDSADSGVTKGPVK